MSEIARMTPAEKKLAVRDHSRKVLYYGLGGITGGVVLAFLLSSWLPLIICWTMACVGGVKHVRKISELLS